MNWMESYKNIPNILPDVIEAFVEVYGEKHRKTITERLQNTLFVYAYTPQNCKKKATCSCFFALCVRKYM